MLSLALSLVIGGWAGWTYLQRGLSDSPAAGGAALVGGPFELVDHTGAARSEKDFLGRYSFIYFGYTFCPDVCPTALWTMSEALDSLAEAAPEKAAQVVPVFFTVDPERDTVDVLATYVESFRPGFVGLTGSLAQATAAAKAYRVFFRKVEVGEPETYLMDHSSIIYLMGPDGAYLDHFTHTAQAEDMAKQLAELIGD